MAGLQREATRLLYKALHRSLTPANDLEYRELLAKYRADGAFAEAVEEAASGSKPSRTEGDEPSRRAGRANKNANPEGLA